MEVLKPLSEPSVLRLGEVTETLTGTWSIYANQPGMGVTGFRGALLAALETPEAKSALSNPASNLSLDIHLTSDHEDDGPRLANLGALSLVTLGIIPLNYFSEWRVTADVKIRERDETLVTDYVFHERGTYSIWAFPLTMFTLAGAGIAGDSDYRNITRRVANNLTFKIIQAVEKDYAKFAARSGVAQSSAAAPSHETAPKPLVV